uniref:Essential protein Yae1 N-terminal domain-containing protein n=1 Tax=Bracon brevicornis TaxID=1563983 RepID=A0A6V7HQT2_9HYME
MTDNTPSKDINEIFERILLAEDCAGQAGYLEGIEAGRKKTFQAYHMGFHRSKALSMKLGYYYGVAESCVIANKFPPEDRRAGREIAE